MGQRLSILVLGLTTLFALVACDSSQSKPHYGSPGKPGREIVRIRISIDPGAYGSVTFSHPTGSIIQHIEPGAEQATVYRDLARGAVTGIEAVTGANSSSFHSEWFFERNTSSWLHTDVSGWGVQLEVER